MKFYRAMPLNTIPAGQDASGNVGGAAADAAGLLGAAPVIALRVADLVSPAGRPPAEGDRTALVVAGTPKIGTSAPYPQVRGLLATDASTRAALAVVSGPSGGPKAEGEQALLDTMPG